MAKLQNPNAGQTLLTRTNSRTDLSDDDKISAEKEFKNYYQKKVNESFGATSNDEIMNAFKENSGSNLKQNSGNDVQIIGTTPSPLSSANVVQDSLSKTTKKVLTSTGEVMEVEVSDGDSAPRETKDTEAFINGGKYARMATSTMTFFSNATLTLQGNSSMMGMFPCAPVEWVTQQFSVAAKSIYLVGTQSIELSGTSLMANLDDLSIEGNATFINNLQVGGSLCVLGELFAAHITTQTEDALTEEALGIGNARINAESVFNCKTNAAYTALNTLTASGLGSITLVPQTSEIGGGKYTFVLDTITLNTIVASLYNNLVSQTFAASISDIKGLQHKHYYTTPSVSSVSSPEQINSEGLESTSATEVVDGVSQPSSGKAKEKSSSAIEEGKTYFTNKVKEAATDYVKEIAGF